MANLTITVDAEVLKRARIKAIERGESVNAYLSQRLSEYAGSSAQTQAIEAVLRLAREAKAGTTGLERTWTRDDLHRV